MDWLLQSLGLESVRYADDIVVLAQDANSAQEALRQISQWMGEAGLTLHPEKTRIVDMSEAKASFDFLGYRFWRTTAGKLIRLIRPKSQQKLRASLRPITKRCNQHSLEIIMAMINPKLRGWFGYFKHAHESELHKMHAWVRMRLRSILRKRKKGSGRGHGLDHFRWPNRYFEKLGLFSLKHARADTVSLLRGAKC